MRPVPTLYFSGAPQSGASAIQQVIFGKVKPNDTFDVEQRGVTAYQTESALSLRIVDVPYNKLSTIDMSDGHLIFIQNAQEPQPMEVITSSLKNAGFATIFLHKKDGVPEEVMLDLLRESQQRLSEDAIEAQVVATSIYDASIFEGLSLVLQKHLNTPVLENLLNITCSLTFIEKLYLLDLSSKLYISMDSASLSAYNIVSDSVDMMVDCIGLYENKIIKKAHITLSHVHILTVQVYQDLVVMAIVRESSPIAWHNLENMAGLIKTMLQ